MKSGVGGFVYVPAETVGHKRKGVSLLMSIRAARDKGEIKDAPDQPTRAFEADDFAWGVLRGMGYDPSKDQQNIEANDTTKRSNRERYGIGANIHK